MGRITGRSAYGHLVRYVSADHYVLSWMWDRKYPGDRLRYPQTMRRDTDRAGAERFTKKWNARVIGPSASAGEALQGDETRSGSAEGEHAAPQSGETP